MARGARGALTAIASSGVAHLRLKRTPGSRTGRVGRAAVAQLNRDSLSAWIDRRELLRAFGAVRRANCVCRVWRGFLLDLGCERGHGVFAAQKGYLHAGAVAGPLSGVFAGVEGFAVYGDFFVDADGCFVGFGADCDAGEEKRYGCECGCEF